MTTRVQFREVQGHAHALQNGVEALLIKNLHAIEVVSVLSVDRLIEQQNRIETLRQQRLDRWISDRIERNTRVAEWLWHVRPNHEARDLLVEHVSTEYRAGCKVPLQTAIQVVGKVRIEIWISGRDHTGCADAGERLQIVWIRSCNGLRSTKARRQRIGDRVRHVQRWQPLRILTFCLAATVIVFSQAEEIASRRWRRRNANEAEHF